MPRQLIAGEISETYPSVPGAGDRRTVTYTPDTAGRLASLNTSATSYAPAASVSSIGYTSHNALKTETYGNSLVHAATYNNRLQPNEIKLGTSGAPSSVVSVTYNYGTTANNGNVLSTSYAGGGLSYTQTFGYDQLNRLTTSQEGASWSQTNSYDPYGNRSIVGGALTFSATNNRITNAGYAYDTVGNLTNDTAHGYTFDAENKISKVDNVAAYVYDGEGQRVRKLVNENLRFIYGIGGQQLAEFDGSSGALKKEYVYGASGLLATIEPTAVNANGTRYTTSDHLGSPRVVTNSSAGVASRHDYMPFGEELFNGGRTVGMGYGAADGLRQKFTLKERDNETGLDYFLARYYSSTQGRFTSVDPENAGADQGDPQSWNGYAYSLNNPLRYIDPDGLRWAQVTHAGGMYDWFDHEKKDDNGQTAYDRALGSGWSAVDFDESKPFSFTNGVFAPGEILQTATLNTNGTLNVSNYTVTWGDWMSFLFVYTVSDTVYGTNTRPKLLADFVSSLVGVDTNIAGSLPSVPPPALGPPQGPPHPRDTARKRGAELVEKFKRAGEGVGRSGGGGEKFKRAASELVREANLTKNEVLRNAMKTEAKRLRLKGGSISHK